MAFADQTRARDAATKFIDKNAGPNHYMAVVNFTGSLQVAQNFTSDANRLREVVSGVKTSYVNPNARRGMGGGVRGLGNIEGAYGARTVLLALGTMAKGLEEISGRKILIFFSRGFPLTPEIQSELQPVLAACNKANVAIYPIDVGGLDVGPGLNSNPAGGMGMPGGRRGGGFRLLNMLSPMGGRGMIQTASFLPEPQRGGAGAGAAGGSAGGGAGSSGGGVAGGGARTGGGATSGGGLRAAAER